MRYKTVPDNPLKRLGMGCDKIGVHGGNDDDVLTAVREGFVPVRMETPAKAVMARGAMMRRHRNSGRLTAGALAAALGAGLGVSAFAHGGAAQDAGL